MPREQHADASSYGLSRLARQGLDSRMDESALLRPYQMLIGAQVYSWHTFALADGRMETSYAAQNARSFGPNQGLCATTVRVARVRATVR